MNHCSTPEQRITWMINLLSSPSPYGLLSQYSRDHQVSRQSLYRWKQKAEQALKEAFTDQAKPTKQLREEVHRQVLTLLIETHASYRQIQTCLFQLLGISLSLGTICQIIEQAGSQARVWLSRQRSQTARALALDEQYSSKRGEAYLNVVDVHSGQVWASLPPAAVDGDSWKIVLWDLHAQGITYDTTVSDGGNAIHEALKDLDELSIHQRDVWHVFHLAAKIQGRVETVVAREEQRLQTIQRYEERNAQEKRGAGRPPKATSSAQQSTVSDLLNLWEAVAYLFQQLRQLLDVVIIDASSASGLLSAPQRQAELETLVDLLFELEEQAPATLKHDLHLVARQIQLALPFLLRFTHRLEQTHQHVAEQLQGKEIQLIAWAWQRRKILGPHNDMLLQGLNPAWRPMAQMLFEAWDQAVRASSVVENWHSIVRPHLAAHRALSANHLALLAVWHNHRVAPRGLHSGFSPLQRGQAHQGQGDWLTAIGYFPAVA